MLLSYRCCSYEMRLPTQVLSFLSSELVIILCLWLGTEGKVGLLVSLWTMREIMCSWVLSERGKNTAPTLSDSTHTRPRILSVPSQSLVVRQERRLRSDCPSVLNLISELLLNEHWIFCLYFHLASRKQDLEKCCIVALATLWICKDMQLFSEVCIHCLHSHHKL